MKKIIIFSVVAIVLFAGGIAGGVFFGQYINGPDEGGEQVNKIPAPGPVVPVGEFTCNLAGPGNRIISCMIGLEAKNEKIGAQLALPNWMSRIRSEILLILKDKVYEDLTSAEGVLQLSRQIQATLNDKLPSMGTDVLVVRVMFESFILQ